MDDKTTDQKHDSNRDPITGEPGAHPVGTGIGAAIGGAVGGGAAAAGAVAGATLGTTVGPVGTAVGAAVGVAVGSIIGAVVGHNVAEKLHPTEEEAYWRENYPSRPYAGQGLGYEDYRLAYQYGWEAHFRHPGRRFEDVEAELERDWQGTNPSLGWDRARPAIRDAWDRIEQRHSAPPPPAMPPLP